MKAFAVALFVIASLTACSTKYVEAVAAYSEAASEGTTSLAGLPSTFAELCHERAVARYLSGQLMSDPVSDNWKSFYDAPSNADGVLSWNDYCAEVVKTSDDYSNLVDLLTAYTEAMKALAGEETWDGQAFNDLTANLGKLAGAIHDNLVEPMAKERRVALGLLEAKASVWAPNKDVTRILSFVEFARATEAANVTARATVLSAQQLIDELKDGQTRLATAPDEKASAAQILGAATDVLVKLNELKAAQSKEEPEG